MTASSASPGTQRRQIPPLPALESLGELEDLVHRERGLCVRYSEGPELDMRRNSIDTESGLELPGLSVNPLGAESWWTRPLRDWLARQLCQYRHLSEKNPARFAWTSPAAKWGAGPTANHSSPRCSPSPG